MPDSLPLDQTVLTAPLRPGRRRSAAIGVAALVSVGLHGALLGGAWWWARHTVPVALVPAESPPIVQLVMSPPGGEPHPAPSPQTPAPATAAEPAPQAAPQPPETSPASEPVQAAAQPTQATTKAETPAPAKPAQETTAPAPVAPDDKLTIDLAQAESDTNAWVTGDSVLPPTADVKFHNRKPSYPEEAAQRGEQGAVVLLIHISAEGLVTGVDVLKSSGFAALDRAARDAVMTWHFLPSIRDGQPVPADMPARFVFALD